MAQESVRGGDFAVTMPLVKVWQDEAGELWFEGVASSTRLDRQQERMTPEAIRKMSEQSGIDLLPSHAAGPLEELGVVEQTWVDNDQFRVAGRLDKSNPLAVRLFERIAAGRRYGLSVGGRVKRAHWEYEEQTGRRVRHIDDVELDHVAVCRPEQAANPDTYLSVMAKAAEAVAPDETVGEAEAGEDLLARIGRSAVEAARHLWPFGRGSQEKLEVEEGEESRAESNLEDLRKQLEETLAEVRNELSALRGLREEKQAEEQPRRGQTQALAGQEKSASDQVDPWRLVV